MEGRRASAVRFTCGRYEGRCAAGVAGEKAVWKRVGKRIEKNLLFQKRNRALSSNLKEKIKRSFENRK
jgi:hypothetical protein